MIMKTIQKKQFNCIISTFLFVFMGIVCAYSQSYHPSQLTDKKWVGRIPQKSYYGTKIFTDKIIIEKYFIYGGETADAEAEFPYYLADRIVDTFQNDLVGKGECGKYIVELRKPKSGEEFISIFEILELTDTTLKIKSLRNKSANAVEYKVE